MHQPGDRPGGWEGRDGRRPASPRWLWLAALVVVGVGAVGVSVHSKSPAPAASPAAPPAPTTTTLPAPTFVAAPLVARAADAAVDVDATLGDEGARSAGTGIVVTPDGEVLTNNHVIAGATAITVTDVGNGRSYPATVVGYSPSEDVAVLRLEGASGLATIPFAAASARLGAAVVAVGNAGGTGGTPATAPGTIVAVGQSISASDSLSGAQEQLQGLIETDAAVKAGDSGGPLVDAYGRVVGIDTAAASGFALGAHATQGFAIPAPVALRVAQQIVDGVRSPDVHIGATAFLGVLVAAYGDSVTALPSDIVLTVTPGSPADQAGVVPGSTITSIDGVPAGTPGALTAELLVLSPGQVVPLDWRDDTGRPHAALVTLADGPPQ